MIDRYTKIVLTIIAVALSAIAVQGTIGAAQAQMSGCGDRFKPCLIDYGGLIAGVGGLPVTVTNWP